jgi:glycosyltransferase involved in cell wall biosynthesis
MTRRRALFVATVPNTLTAFLLEYARYFQERGWTVDAAASGISQSALCRKTFDAVYDVEFARSLWRLGNYTKGISQIASLVQSGSYDIVHVHSPIASVLTRFALRNHKTPLIVYTAHGFHFFKGNNFLKNRFYYTAEKIAAQWTDYLVLINEEDFQAARGLKTIPSERVLLTDGIGVQIQKYDSATANAHAKEWHLPLPAGSEYVLMVGEFIERKRPWDAIAAFAHVPNPNVHLVMAGTGRLLEKMKLFARHQQLADRVHFIGFRNDIAELLRNARALLLPSEQEGLPRCILEAFCAETPVIGTNIRGTRDLLKDGAGLLVNVARPDEIAEKIQLLLNDEALGQSLSACAKTRVQRYSFESVVPAYENIYYQGTKRGMAPAMHRERSNVPA